jgi:hypothetical protein
MPDKPDLDQLLAVALAAAEAKRPKFERRSGNDRRSGRDRRETVSASYRADERRQRDRRSGVDQRVVTSILPPAPPP